MRILLLSSRAENMIPAFVDDELVISMARPQELPTADWLVSYGYRYRLPASILSLFPNRALNLHISLLPWNRGSDPNLWSWINNTPKGVSIHLIDSGFDTGAIVAQRVVHFQGNETLRSSYEKLSIEIETLFVECWPTIRAGSFRTVSQPTGGSYHTTQDGAPILESLPFGWDTAVEWFTDRQKH